MKNKILKSLTIIFPLYNEENRLKKSLKYINQLYIDFKKIDLEIILVNDGSTDDSNIILNNFMGSLKKKNLKKTKYLNYKNNKGKGYALKKGIKYASKKWILTSDIDFSANPNILKKWVSNKFIVSSKACYFGSRRIKNSKIKYELYRKIFGEIFSSFRKLFFIIDISDTQCGFKLYPNNIAKKIFKSLTETGYTHDVEICILLKKLKINVYELPIKWEHVDGSKVNVFKDGLKMLCELIKLKIKYV